MNKIKCFVGIDEDAHFFCYNTIIDKEKIKNFLNDLEKWDFVLTEANINIDYFNSNLSQDDFEKILLYVQCRGKLELIEVNT